MAASISQETLQKHKRLKSKIINIFQCKRFCCICFDDKQVLTLWDTLFSVPKGSTLPEKSLKDILECTFGSEITTLLPNCYFCEDCIDVVLQAYQMLQEIALNNNILQYFTKKITEQIHRNTIKLADDVQSIVFSIEYPNIQEPEEQKMKTKISLKSYDQNQKDIKIQSSFKTQIEIECNDIKKDIISDGDCHDSETLNEILLESNPVKKQCIPKQEPDVLASEMSKKVIGKVKSGVKKEIMKKSSKATLAKHFKTNNSNEHNLKIKTNESVHNKVKKDFTLKKSKDFKCYLCLAHFTDQRELIEHSKHCFEISYVSKTDSVKADEDISNENEICDQCGKLVSLLYIEKHKKGHERQKQCPTCLEFINLVKYDKHLSLHQEPKKHLKSCSNCNYETKYSELLEAHMNKEHLHVRPYKCDKCQKSFHSKLVWKEHIKIHDRRKTQQCDVCGDRFAYTKSLVLHMRLHTGYTPYKCDLCEESFLSSSRRQTHKLTKHSGGPTFQCEICLRKYFRRSTMRKHQKTHDCKAQVKRLI